VAHRPSLKFFVRGLVVPVFLVAAFPLPAAGAEEPKSGTTRLGEVKRALEKSRGEGRTLKRDAKRLDRDIKKLRRDTIAAAKAIQDYEAQMTGLEERLRDLARIERDKRKRLRQRRDQFARVLMALQRIARNPPEAMFVRPLTPSETVRGAILLRAAVPQIETRAARLKADIQALADTKRETIRRRAELASATSGLEAERHRLDGLVSRKRKARAGVAARAKSNQQRQKRLSREARDLKDLLNRLERQRREREEKARARAKVQAASIGPSIAKARGRLPLPVIGRIVGLYGQSTGPGMTRKGIAIRTRSGGQVIAPFGGLVVFAGSFKGYGQLLIIEHGEGYHSLLAGMAYIDGVIGQTVLAGEPIGAMKQSERENPTLYLELRRKGQPINPLPWLAAGKGKVKG